MKPFPLFRIVRKATSTALCLLAIAAPAAAQQGADRVSVTERFKSGLIDFSKEMIDVASSVRSVQDVERAEARISASMNRLTVLVLSLVDNFETMSEEEGREVIRLRTLMIDPEVVRWMSAAETALDSLKSRHPEAAARLEEIGTKQSDRFVESMARINAMIQRRMERSEAGSATE